MSATEPPAIGLEVAVGVAGLPEAGPARRLALHRAGAVVEVHHHERARARERHELELRDDAAVIARDHHRCRVPGCRSSRWIEVHHVQPRAQGGRHTLDNLICLCGGHHDAVHAGRLQITRAPSGDLAFTHADGRRYGAPPTTTRARAEVATHADRATHADLSREQLVQRAIHEEPPP